MKNRAMAEEFRRQVEACRPLGRRAMVDIVNGVFDWGPQNHLVLKAIEDERVAARSKYGVIPIRSVE